MENTKYGKLAHCRYVTRVSKYSDVTLDPLYIYVK